MCICKKILFDVKFVVESVFNYCNMNWTTEMSQKIDGNGIIIAGDNGYEVDSKAEKTYKARVKGPLRDLLKKYKGVFTK